MAVRTCKVCGKEFTNYKAQKYCGWNCWLKIHEAKYVTLQCDLCGKSFNRLKWYLSTTKDCKRFCSKECSSKGKSPGGRRIKYNFLTRELLEEQYLKKNKTLLTIAKEYDVSYHNIHDRVRTFGLLKGKNPYKSYKTLVYGKYSGKCKICGWKEGRCDIHHIVERKDGGTNDITNLVLLCPNHHRLWHEGKLKI